MGLPSRLVSWGLNRRQHVQYGQQRRSLLLACGAGAAQDVCVITLFKPPWPIYPLLSVLLSSHGGRSSGQIRCSSSSVWSKSSSSANASGETQLIEELWEEYFADPWQWWDNRVNKRNPRSPDFKHKVTRDALWVDGWSTPAWVKTRLKSVTQDNLQSHVVYRTKHSQDNAEPIRLPKGNNNGERNTLPTSARELRQIVQGSAGSKHMQGTRTTSEAIATLKNLLQQGMALDSNMYVEVLKRCLEEKDLRAAKQAHDCIIKSGMEQNTYVANYLLSVYIRCGRLHDARQVFDELPKKNIFSWNIMIGGYAQHNHAKEAMDVFNEMRQKVVQPNEVTYVSILKACASPSALKLGKEVHVYIRHGGLESDVRVGTALLKMYAKCGCIQEARQAFENLRNRDAISWNVMIGAYAESGRGVEAHQLFLQMQQEGFKPNAITYMSILNAAASAGSLEWVQGVHSHALKAGLESDLRVGSALVHMYAKCGSMDDARLVFDRMEKRNAISWNVMIGAYAESGRGVEAHRLFLQMIQEGFQPNAITYLSILNVAASAGSLEWVKEVHCHALKAGLESDLRVGSALVHMYAKCGSMDDARLVFDRMEKRDAISWNVMIGAYAESGRGVDAHELFLQMIQEGFKPNAITYMSILNAAASAGSLEWVREVHSHALKAGLESDVRVGNALVHMYAKGGSMDDARLVFDTMEKRNAISWNVMIGAYAESGRGGEAYQLFLQMQQEGYKPDGITYVSILNAAASAGSLEWVREVHSHALKAGLESDVRVGSALVHMYAKGGSVDDARLVFERMEKRDAISWTVMIGAYADSGRGVEAHRLFLQMLQEGFEPNAITYLSILNVAASAGSLEWVREVHSHAVKAGVMPDLRVGNALVHMYAKGGSVDDARLVFERMEKRDAISWNVMIGAYADSGRGVEAHRLFLQMLQEGFEPSAITYMSILNVAASAGSLEWVKEVHSHAVKAGLESDLRVGSALVHMYAKCGSMDDARLVFDRMEKRDAISWNVMIGAYAESGRGVDAHELFLQMIQEGFKPNAITYMSILNAAASAGSLEWVREVHSHALKAGLESDVRVGNALVHMYAKGGSMDDARLVFDTMEKRNAISWNVMIGAYAESGRGGEAYQLFLQMQQEGYKPDGITYVSILNAAASAGSLEWVREVHSHALKAGLESDVRVGNALVHMYAKGGSMDDARLVFERMEKRDAISWNVLIGAYAKSGCGIEAHQLFLKMQQDGFQPDAFTYVSILNAAASAGSLEWVREVHSHAVKAGLESDLRVGNALVHMFAKGGSVDDARLVFERMEKRDTVSWTVMIGGLAQHGRGREALKLFWKMHADGVRPDEYSFVAVLWACSHAGLVNEGRRLFSAMTRDYAIEPTVLHCNCMVDLLGRAGQLEEAKLFIGNMPVPPNEATWGALLGACRTYGDVELGEVAAKEVLKLEPKGASPYVLLSNIYAAAGKWEEVALVRSMMQERGVRKEPGRSWIEVDNKIHDFVVGDTCHPEAKEIYAELNRLGERIKAEGYTPDTRLVLQNINEEDKELALCSHSEKLAIAYGLMRLPPGKPIRVYNNLRVCSDCHTATKFISKVTGREIVARDANRFHHFKDGVCSCGDYW